MPPTQYSRARKVNIVTRRHKLLFVPWSQCVGGRAHYDNVGEGCGGRRRGMRRRRQCLRSGGNKRSELSFRPSTTVTATVNLCPSVTMFESAKLRRRIRAGVRTSVTLSHEQLSDRPATTTAPSPPPTPARFCRPQPPLPCTGSVHVTIAASHRR